MWVVLTGQVYRVYGLLVLKYAHSVVRAVGPGWVYGRGELE